MRLYPPAWGIAREALADCEIGGYDVPKGTQIFMVQMLVHRDGRWFDDPETFKPERWDNDLIKRLPRCAYFPFGDGPRICIGNHFAMMEAVLILATIASGFGRRSSRARPSSSCRRSHSGRGARSRCGWQPMIARPRGGPSRAVSRWGRDRWSEYSCAGVLVSGRVLSEAARL